MYIITNYTSFHLSSGVIGGLYLILFPFMSDDTTLWWVEVLDKSIYIISSISISPCSR